MKVVIGTLLANKLPNFENNFGFAGLGSVESLRFFLERLSMVSFRAHLPLA
jgi:hypothetical protein